MEKVVLIAPDEKLAITARAVILKNNENVKVYVGSLSEGLSLARELYLEGANIVISRGGTADLIRRNLDIPVIRLETTSYEIISSINEAYKHSGKIGIVGFKSLTSSYLKVSDEIESIFSLSVRIETISTQRDARDVLKKMYQTGIRVFLGGIVVNNTARDLGYDSVLIGTSEETILDAINQAYNLYEVQSKEKEKTQLLNSIIDFAYDGILAVDKSSRITVFNPITERITNVNSKDAIGRIVDEVVENTRMSNVLRTGKKEIGEIQKIGNTTIVTNRVPIIVNGETIGAVATFQKVEELQRVENQIRKKLLFKGHVAKTRFENIIGNSGIVMDTFKKAKLYAKSDCTIIIHGETGTGKELFAQSIHNESSRKDNPFVAVNCAALPENLLESELFGYVEGAFTGARKNGKTGLFELAHGGTLFLDEISEISPKLQSRFLRVIQEKEVTRLGDDRVIPIDTRIIAATNKNLAEEVETNKFRADLYYRLCVLSLEIPPLRNRKSDIRELTSHFLRAKKRNNDVANCSINEKALSGLMNYDWPGNIRQLENVIERCIVLSNGNCIGEGIVKEALDSMQIKRDDYKYKKTKEQRIRISRLGDNDEELILRVLEESNWNKKQTAEKLGISVTTLWRRLKKIEQNNID